MINFNLDLKHADEILKSPVVMFLLMLIFSSLSFIFGMSLASQDPKVVCAEQIKVVFEQNELINDLETEHAKCIADGQTSCIEREQRICRTEKEKIKTNCNKLVENILGKKDGE